MGVMKETGQSVLTPRSNTITGSCWQAVSTTGVRAAVVLGDTIRMSQSPDASRPLMSLICLLSEPSASMWMKRPMLGWRSIWACMVVQPTTRQGLLTPALEKHTVQGPSLAYALVSTQVGSMAWIQGWSAGPSASICM